MLNTPILFMIFNRPDTTARVFEEIRKIQPKQLYVAADGPRPDRESDKAKCEQTRKIATQVDWDCEVKTFFRSANAGCGVAPAQNITWFFENVEQGIILEDDCLPDPSFFYYCEELLAYYKDNPKVFQITGNNFQHGQRRGKASYYFSKYTHICGWATWRRAWKYYDFEMKSYDDFKKNNLLPKLAYNKKEANFWQRKFEMLSGGKRRDIWDYQWFYACRINGGLSAVPNVNLISNIGFNADATHTTAADPRVANLKTENIGQPIIHPEQIEVDVKADVYTFFKSGSFFHPTLRDLVRWKAKSVLPMSFLKYIKRKVL